jgi:hypothetical protein
MNIFKKAARAALVTAVLASPSLAQARSLTVGGASNNFTVLKQTAKTTAGSDGSSIQHNTVGGTANGVSARNVLVDGNLQIGQAAATFAPTTAPAAVAKKGSGGISLGGSFNAVDAETSKVVTTAATKGTAIQDTTNNSQGAGVFLPKAVLKGNVQIGVFNPTNG